MKPDLKNTFSASHKSRDTMNKNVGLRIFTSYLYQYLTAGTQQLQHNNSNIGPS